MTFVVIFLALHTQINNMLKFYKYHGAGNDFILIDSFTKEKIEITTEQIKFLCHRRFGIGADGLMILKKHPNYDFEMEYYNSDGSGATMCGNGGRCIIAFANKLGIIENETSFLASDGMHKANILESGEVSLKMNDVENITVIGEDRRCYTGSPHYIRYVKNLEELDVYNEGRKIRYSDNYKKEGINVNFVQIINDNTISIRTYERGVEDETYACGTGSVAAALTFADINNVDSAEYTVKVKGGKLKVSFEKRKGIYENIWLTGPAKFVFEGITDF